MPSLDTIHHNRRVLKSRRRWGLPLLAQHTGWRFAFLVLAPGPALGCWAMAALRGRPEALRLAAGRR